MARWKLNGFIFLIFFSVQAELEPDWTFGESGIKELKAGRLFQLAVGFQWVCRGRLLQQGPEGHPVTLDLWVCGGPEHHRPEGKQGHCGRQQVSREAEKAPEDPPIESLECSGGHGCWQRMDRLRSSGAVGIARDKLY
ncbi:hypothetical protein [Curvibacter lanceolatus]|uniref:hypothetical protein n=1 Tax=Curvibacter lanceolatus TaxID=86182 RepID=UPI001FE1B393|nr:hypothetical protein [Curvibacter lanceolatus]